MLNQTGIKKETYGSTNQILFNVEPQVSVGIVVDDSVQATANSLGKKIVKAGTPLTGDLTNRLTPFTAAKAGSASEASDAVGVLLHDVDVTTGDANGTLLIFGFVNLDRIDETTQGKLTSYVKAALAGRVTFLK
jgi:hypothetical protein